MTQELQDAARAALEAHDALRSAKDKEPPNNSEGMPLDPVAWLHWRDTLSKPAYDRWKAAMDELENALGEPGMSRHPFNFRPVCDDILARAER